VKIIILALTVLLITACSREPKTVQIAIKTSAGVVHYQVEIADNAFSRAQGLMNRDPLPLNAGMLFLYDDETPVIFWMKNVSFPLDIIFINNAGSIVKIQENALPYDLMPIRSKVPISAVLELLGGTVKLDKIALQNTIDISALRKHHCKCTDENRLC